MKLIPLFLKITLSFLLISSDNSFAQDLFAKENRYLAYVYQQKEYQLVDPEGDHLLIWSVSQLPHSILSQMRGQFDELQKERNKKLNELLERYPHFRPGPETLNVLVPSYTSHKKDHHPIRLEGRLPPFSVKNLSLMLKQVIFEEYSRRGITPTFGEIHKWSPSGKKRLKKKILKTVQMSKLLLALSRGVTSKYLVTGMEEDLKEYLILREQESVNLEEMFRVSYKLNAGDVYLTLLTIENVLSQFWLSHQRDKRLITTKLKDITNYYYSTDKFGAWYHLFGIMLYGYAEGGMKAHLAGRIESLGGGIMSRFKDEWQEEFINANGGKVGGKLKAFIKKKEYLTFKEDPKYLEEDFYMNLNEDFTQRLEEAMKRTMN